MVSLFGPEGEIEFTDAEAYNGIEARAASVVRGLHTIPWPQSKTSWAITGLLQPNDTAGSPTPKSKETTSEPCRSS